MAKELPKFLKPTKKKIIIAGVIVVLAVGAIVGVNVIKNKKASQANAGIKLSTVDRGDIENTITGSGTVEPYERYEVIASVQGEVLSAPYEIGDTVKKDDILYQIDSSDAQIDLQKQQNSLKQSALSTQESKDDLDKLSVTAPCDGVISGLDIKSGEDVSNNAQIATITSTQDLKVDLPFNEAQKNNISVGQTAEISSSSHMSKITGKVTHVASNPTAQSDGSVLYNVTVEFTNPGSFDDTTVVGGEINGMISPSSGTVQYQNKKTVSTETDGTVVSVKYTNGDYVKKGAVIATLSNTSISNSVEKSNLSYEDAQLSLQSKLNSLDDYTITSPIDGTILTKEYKVGDTIGKSDASVTMMVVGDISKLKFSLSIDELDISKVQTGQTVEITCDAVEGETFEGRITNVSLEGTAENGVTTYAAEVVIDEPGSLRPSMNIDASVIVESVQNVLRLPTTDVKTVGNTSYVFVKDDSASSKSKDNKSKNDDKSDKPDKSGMPGGNSGNMPNGEPPADGSSENAPKGEPGGGKLPDAPDGFTAKAVETGISSDDYIEIKSGLNEGDQVYKQSVSSSSSDSQMPGGMDMMGGPGGGGAPGGGGGAPGGGGGAPGGGGGPRG